MFAHTSYVAPAHALLNRGEGQDVARDDFAGRVDFIDALS